jgi:predicted nucleic acid-binding protein
MTTSRWVVDSTVLLDLATGELLDVALALPGEWETADAVGRELLQPPVEVFLDAGLRLVPLTGSQVLEVARLSEQHLQPSAADLSALVVARASGAILLTGDRALRRAAEREGVEVHGILWLLDMLVETDALTPENAAGALHKMLVAGARLPAAETRARLDGWSRE